MKRFVQPLALLTAVALPMAAGAQAMFTGDKKLACEAILCLSTGSRPSECSPPIKKYFSITARKMSDTIKERKDFLKLCPSADDDDNMRELVDDIANGAGRCDAASLNAAQTVWSGFDGDGRTVVGNKMPSHCAAYGSNVNVDQTNATVAKYVGDPEHGGYWVEASKYEEALAEYNKRRAEEAANANRWNNNDSGWNTSRR